MNRYQKFVIFYAILTLVVIGINSDLEVDAYAINDETNPSHKSPKSDQSSIKEIVCGDKFCNTPKEDPKPENIAVTNQNTKQLEVIR